MRTHTRVQRHDDADGPSRVQRYDRGEILSKSVKTREGFILVEGFAARPGIYEYTRADGTTQRELVPASELADPDSLATLARKPLTFTHPSKADGGMVTPRNAGRLTVGDVDGQVEVRKNGFVSVKLAIRRQDAITAVDRGVVELSPGYTTRLDETPGTDPVFGDYDAIQRDRQYNHLAIVHKARGGSSMRLRADGAQEAPGHSNAKRGPDMIKLLTLLGLANLRADSTDDAKQDAAVDAVTALIGERDTLQAKVDSIPSAEDQDKSRLDWFNERSPLVEKATALKLDGIDTLDNAELTRQIVCKANPNARKDGSEAYYAAAYDLLPEAPAQKADAFQAFGTGFGAAPEERADSMRMPTGQSKIYTDSLTAEVG